MPPPRASGLEVGERRGADAAHGGDGDPGEHRGGDVPVQPGGRRAVAGQQRFPQCLAPRDGHPALDLRRQQPGDHEAEVGGGGPGRSVLEVHERDPAAVDAARCAGWCRRAGGRARTPARPPSRSSSARAASAQSGRARGDHLGREREPRRRRRARTAGPAAGSGAGAPARRRAGGARAPGGGRRRAGRPAAARAPPRPRRRRARGAGAGAGRRGRRPPTHARPRRARARRRPSGASRRRPSGRRRRAPAPSRRARGRRRRAACPRPGDRPAPSRSPSRRSAVSRRSFGNAQKTVSSSAACETPGRSPAGSAAAAARRYTWPLRPLNVRPAIVCSPSRRYATRRLSPTRYFAFTRSARSTPNRAAIRAGSSSASRWGTAGSGARIIAASRGW